MVQRLHALLALVGLLGGGARQATITRAPLCGYVAVVGLCEEGGGGGGGGLR